MSESSKTTSVDAENNYQRHCKTCKKGYVVVIEDDQGTIYDTPFASFDRGLAEEIALEYAWELMWEAWYWLCHGPYDLAKHGYGPISLLYELKLTNFYIKVKEIPWYE